MRKGIYFIVITMLFLSCSLKKETHWNLNFERNSKEPYGCYIAYQCLKDLFPTTAIVSEKNPMVAIREVIKSGASGEVVVVVCNEVKMDSLSWVAIQTFIEMGNDVVIFSSSLPEQISDQLRIKATGNSTWNSVLGSVLKDTIRVQTVSIDFYKERYSYQFKGVSLLPSYLVDSMDENNTSVWGHQGREEMVNLVSWYHQGSLTLCSSPAVMTNYFLLQGNNREYFERFFSTFRVGVEKITWTSGTVVKMDYNEEDMWDLLWKLPSLLYAFLILFVLLLIYILFESKRRQRMIPVLHPNTNSSLEFSETIGRLYYNKRDHRNLMNKMLLHYFEHIRSKYMLPTNDLNETFAQKLSAKINRPLEDTKAFLAYVDYIRSSSDISDTDIIHLHHQLKKYS